VPPPPPPSRRKRRRWIAGGVVLWLLLFWPLARLESWPVVAALGKLALGALAVLALVWLLVQTWRRALWRVGRRLAFSYLLVGVLPLALIALLLLVATYMTAGFLLGHLYRDGVAALRGELERIAEARLGGREEPPRPLLDGLTVRVAEYRRGLRVGADTEAPAIWPGWLAQDSGSDPDTGVPESRQPFLALSDGRLTAAATAGNAAHGVLVWLEEDPARALRAETHAWVQLYRADDPRKLPTVTINVGVRAVRLRGLWLHRDRAEVDEYARLNPPRRPGARDWTEQPFLLWMEHTGPLRALATGAEVAESVAISLAASPRGLFGRLLSASEQADSTAWLVLAGVGVLLFEIWVVAAAVAVFMIFGISRAVNRLSRATAAIARGDFSVRIPVRRKDQVGDLQRDFNAMAEHLGELVETAAQKEAIDKELELARRVQRDLLPDLIESGPRVELATTFQPSSAIGGDYFDVLERPGGRLAIVVADVSGHGLAAGLRMAMVKSALTLLVEEPLAAREILARLRRLMRNRPGERGFLTLAFSELDPATGELEITNAGHPPCYLVRRAGAVEEVAIPGLPLGALAGEPGSGHRTLAPGDAFVWLSDGIPECASREGEPFGYERVQRALGGPVVSAEALRDRLLAALDGYCGDAPVQDDRTMVVLRYVPEPGSQPSAA
jgi:serine phosphatase RsbU (regulator of sigma subunit)